MSLCLLLLALLLLARTGHLRLPVSPALVRYALLATGCGFVCRAIIPNVYVGFFKTLRRTRWARYDTWLYSPLFLSLGLLILWLAGAEIRPPGG